MKVNFTPTYAGPAEHKLIMRLIERKLWKMYFILIDMPFVTITYIYLGEFLLPEKITSECFQFSVVGFFTQVDRYT